MDSHRLAKLTTEGRNSNSAEIDRRHPLEIVRLINREDRNVIEAVAACESEIARVVELVENAFRSGGRLIYMGAGTSGRLGVLDASECPPTFNTPPGMIVGLIAGGDTALRTAIEGAEDNPSLAQQDLMALHLSANDCAMGIATSGRTPYVLGGLEYARSIGCVTLGHTCNAASEMQHVCDILIETIVGPEIISGSTRLKSGTATKLVLNTITTASMVRLGKTYGNLMVDLRATNRKLVQRSRRLVATLTGLQPQAVQTLLDQAQGEVKTAIVMHHRQVTADQARSLLSAAGGQLRRVIGDVTIHHQSSSSY